MLWDEPKIFFLERRYFFSIILSEFLKNRVALQMRPSLHWKNMENLIFPRKGGGIFEKLLDFTEKFYIIVELVICIAGKSLLT